MRSTLERKKETGKMISDVERLGVIETLSSQINHLPANAKSLAEMEEKVPSEVILEGLAGRHSNESRLFR